MRRSTIARTQIKKREKRKKWLYILIGLVGFAILGAFFDDEDDKYIKPPPKKEESKTEVAPQKPEWQKEQFSVWDGSHRKTVAYIKKRMHNPKSFKHVQTHFVNMVDGKHRLITMTYRGSNAFNAIVTNTTVVKVDLKGNVISVVK